MNIFTIIIIFFTVAYITLIGLFIYGLYNLYRQNTHAKNTQAPEGISIVVPFRNEVTRIQVLLQSLEKLKLPSIPVEIIYVDDSSTDNTKNIIAHYHHTHLLHLPFSIVQAIGEGKKSAQQTGIQLARFSYVALTDADCSLPELWLEKILDTLEADTVLWCGLVDYDQHGLLWSQQFFNIEHRALVLCGAASFGLKKPIYCSGANMVVHKPTYNQLLQHLHASDIASGDDVFLLHTALELLPVNRIKYCLDIEARVKTVPPPTFNEFFKQRIRWGAKTRLYRLLFPKYVATIVFCFHLILFGLLIANVFSAHCFKTFIILMTSKIFAEAVLFHQSRKLFDDKYIFFKHIVWQPVYILYIVAAGIMAAVYTNKTLKKRWR